ncbi:phage tail fiber protein [Burkholderia oklahomensis]|uniref:Phage T7 tail fiber family protein n=1 Tax=Burkholderia oklahomensis TaxID=342113 RepID=A0AAI8BF35_9BURK|nr:phage tail fiber protein [Burkholderia oklahomensis]AIO70874.1 phage T7 tail fiber family protein [Burkholderia oklahomensis]AOI40092.1 hypothetical protein WG70_11040 [Burkholderia oklahomensis EO147]KUY68350.1 hypothetical protein WG70_25120 [Burkholderia oklahomensis EO147]QPS39537.1 DUF1983 domain-containing protein [Burkholderia oklahomensis]
MTFPKTYQTDGTTTVWSFDFPYLDRSNVFVIVNDAARAFTFIDDHTIKCVDSFGNPFPKGLPLTISRATPDLISFAEFKDAAKLTADDLNRARLQCLLLIQERSGGMAGAVGTVISSMVNEIETISGALDSLAEVQGVLQAGLGTLNGLSDRLTVQENGAKALQDQINQEIENRKAAGALLAQRMDSLDIDVGNQKAMFQSQIQLLQSSDEIMASQVTSLSARLSDVEAGQGDGEDSDEVAASLLSAAITSVKKDHALAQQITTLSADINGNIKAQLQVEQTARVDADKALAEQITSLQAQIGDNLSQVIQEMHTEIDATNGKVTKLQAQYTLKAQVQREDGTVVMGGIGLAATANDDYVGSKLVLMADAILFADPNTPNGELVQFLQAGLVDGSPTLVVPSARVGDKTVPGRVLVDGAVEARTIKANSITGDKLVAGTISTDKLQVGLGANLLKNSTFVNLQGWATWMYGGGAGDLILDQPDWFPAGGHAAGVHSAGTWGSADPNAMLIGLYSDKVPVVGGGFYEYSGFVGVHRCAANVGIEWYDANGAIISASGYGSAGTATVVGQAGGGKTLGGYVRIGGIAKAPVNAASALIQFRKGMNVSPDTDSWMFVTQPMIAETSASATRLSPYTPSGLGTLITPAGISTPSLSALSANIGLLRTATSGQRMEIDGSQIRSFDGNNVMRARFGVW